MKVNFVGMTDATPEPPELAVLRAQAILAAQKVRDAEHAEEEQVRKQDAAARSAQADEARELFEPLTVETERERARFAALYREACLSLGRLSKSAALLTDLCNRVNAVRVAPDQVMLTTVQNLARCPNPLPGLLDEGYQPDPHVGHTWSCLVVPIVAKGEPHV